ncbi:hypothetical protein [Methylobacterium sp. 17Sr1-1]|uniref:hypothetical protein n=1 Tax=Methylobacterium sp. 17Sr1-1 TaxID=2202826 RepID=UPI001FE1D938|nr:hypothetical protein [Methylobacterium sp. 17Sr1-1]
MRTAILSSLVSALLIAAVSPTQAQTAGDPALLVHGHYCGLGSRAPLPPVDALDAACARHDACTPPDGLPPRWCNRRLFREADLISRDPRQSDELRNAAGFIAFGASLLPYDPAPPTVAVVRGVRHEPQAIGRRPSAAYYEY